MAKEDLPIYLQKALKQYAVILIGKGYTGSLLEKYRDMEITEKED